MLELSESDLAEMKLPLGPRKRVIKQIRNLNGSTNSGSASNNNNNSSQSSGGKKGGYSTPEGIVCSCLEIWLVDWLVVLIGWLDGRFINMLSNVVSLLLSLTLSLSNRDVGSVLISQTTQCGRFGMRYE